MTKISPNRKKILEAIVYFSKKLKYPSLVMMYKVLAELDYRHLQETGNSVTNLEYFAWDKGPVPKDFDREISDRECKEIILPKDFSTSLRIDKQDWVDEKGNNRYAFYFKEKRKANLDLFSPRQQKILNDIADIYKNTSPTDASNASHERDKPWYKVYVIQNKKGEYIDFFEFLPKNSQVNVGEAKENLFEIAVFQKNYQH